MITFVSTELSKHDSLDKKVNELILKINSVTTSLHWNANNMKTATEKRLAAMRFIDCS